MNTIKINPIDAISNFLFFSRKILTHLEAKSIPLLIYCEHTNIADCVQSYFRKAGQYRVLSVSPNVFLAGFLLDRKLETSLRLLPLE